MWVFLNNAMLSIVADMNDRDRLLVRARCDGDIERTFPDAETFTDPTADYYWRAYLPRDVVAKALADRIEDIGYTNFKNSIPKPDMERHGAYIGVWSVMNRYQNNNRYAQEYAASAIADALWDDEPIEV